jgi:hypothetical protein
MSIDPKGLRGFRGDMRRSNDPDETEGRALHRARAEAEASRSLNKARKVSLK